MAPPTTARSGRKGGDRKSKSARAGLFYFLYTSEINFSN